MTSKERREKGMLFIADDNDWVEMKRARQLTQKLNNMDRCDFEGINAIVRELFGKADESTFLNPNPFPIGKIWFGFFWFGAGVHKGFTQNTSKTGFKHSILHSCCCLLEKHMEVHNV